MAKIDFIRTAARRGISEQDAERIWEKYGRTPTGDITTLARAMGIEPHIPSFITPVDFECSCIGEVEKTALHNLIMPKKNELREDIITATSNGDFTRVDILEKQKYRLEQLEARILNTPVCQNKDTNVVSKIIAITKSSESTPEDRPHTFEWE